MDINTIIITIMVIFMILGAIDRMIGNRFGLGQEFEEGFHAMGPLSLAMLGGITLAPVLARILSPIVVPIYGFFGADPSVFAGTILACDMGGYPLAMELANTPEAGVFSGIILGTMMGPVITFNIPVALSIARKEDHRAVATGMLAGIITIPIGSLVGGLVGGLGLMDTIRNLIPIAIIAGLIAIGLWRIPDRMIRIFTMFGKVIIAILTLGLAASIVEYLTGFVVIPGLGSLEEGFLIIGAIAIVLAGAFPMVYVITKVFNKPLTSFGQRFGMNDVAAAGFLASLANNIPTFNNLRKMNYRGKVLNVAFAVSAGFTFGDHLGFTAGVEPNMIVPMIVGKLVGGITAVILASLVLPKRTVGDIEEGIEVDVQEIETVA